MINPPVHINRILHTVDVDEAEVEDVDEVSHPEVQAHIDGLQGTEEILEVDLEVDSHTETGIDPHQETAITTPTEDLIEAQPQENLKRILGHPTKTKIDVFCADNMDTGKMNAHRKQTQMMKDKVQVNTLHMISIPPPKNISVI